MNEEPGQIRSNEPPRGNGSSGFLWLFCAFVPALIALPLLNVAVPALVFVILGLNVICSFLAGTGLVQGMKDGVARFFLGLFLTGVFFVLNVIIVVYVGFSHSSI